MKRNIKIAAIIAFILVDTVLIYHFTQTYQEKKTAKEKIEVLQFFSLKGVDGRVFTEKKTSRQIAGRCFVFFNSA